mmetsp:Transcript_13503/g.30676  ORF Transcript_13503/g.30676 Transcript_13503/m.30676 type:complete len:247 (-) Transcript_13503:745-1485(-)
MSAISPMSLVIVSLISSMSREANAAFRVSVALSCSQPSLFFRSFDSSFCKAETILSMASMTASKWPPEEAATRAARADNRLSPLAAAASFITVAATWICRAAASIRLRRRLTCKRDSPCDAKDFLKLSRASSLCRIATASLMAFISFIRRSLRAFHSSFLASSAVFVWVMYSPSSLTCVSSASISACASALVKPRAPFSLSKRARASAVASRCLVFAAESLSYAAFAAASCEVASAKLVLKVTSRF